MALDLFIVAGEASADHHAAALLKQFKRLHPETHAFGVGGELLKKEGMEIIVSSGALSVVGGADWFDRAGEIWQSYKKTVNAIETRKPKLAILLDLPDFNLRLVKRLKRQGVPVVYYISPQVWAWRKYRIQKIKKFVDKMLVVFPFEKTFYEKEGVSVDFVGHPLLEQMHSRSAYRDQTEIEKAPQIALLPGSRKSELKYHGPILNETIEKVLQKYPNAQFRIPVPDTIPFEMAIQTFGIHPNVQLERGNSREIMEWGDLALIASGTATLEAALVGTPFALFYKVSSSSAWIFRFLIRYKNFIGMPNILLEREVAHEFFQSNVTSENLAQEALILIRNPNLRQEKANSLKTIWSLLGQKGASQRAAYAAHKLYLEYIENQKPSSLIVPTNVPATT